MRCRKALLLLFDDASASSRSRRHPSSCAAAATSTRRTGGGRASSDIGREVVETRHAAARPGRASTTRRSCASRSSARDRSIGLLSAINSRTRSFTEEQITLLAVLGAFAGAAIENARLRTQSEYALLAGERNRIAKEMHDGLAQSLFSASLALEVCKRRVRTRPAEVEEKLGETQQLLSDSLTELRRYIYDLRPVSLERLGSAGAIQLEGRGDRAGRQAQRRAARRSAQERPLAAFGRDVPVPRRAGGGRQRGEARRTRHRSSSRSTYGKDVVELLVEDDGDGFDVEAAAAARGERPSRSVCAACATASRPRAAGSASAARRTGGTNVWVTLPC